MTLSVQVCVLGNRVSPSITSNCCLPCILTDGFITGNQVAPNCIYICILFPVFFMWNSYCTGPNYTHQPLRISVKCSAGNHILWSFYMRSSTSTHPPVILLIMKPLLQFDRTSRVLFHAMSPQQAKKSNLETQAREANMYWTWLSVFIRRHFHYYRCLRRIGSIFVIGLKGDCKGNKRIAFCYTGVLLP